MSRYRAAWYHFLISLGILVFLAYLVVFVWYPGFFFTIDGGWQGMRLITAVDLVLGPLLTLIVFKAGKPGLKFDLTVIGLLQSLCLAAGLFIVYNERPQFFVFYDGYFYSNSADTYLDFGQTPPSPSEFAETTPAYVIALPPSDPIEEADLRRLLFQDRTPLWAYPAIYETLSEHQDKVMQSGFTLAEVRTRDNEGALDRWISRHGGDESDYLFVPVQSRYGNPFVGISKRDRSFIGILDVPAPLARGDVPNQEND